MNRETLINSLAEASTLREDTIINPVMTYVRRDILKATVSMLVVDKIAIHSLYDQLRVLKERIECLEEEIAEIESDISGEHDD